jgi:ankyrin repeat protein
MLSEDTKKIIEIINNENNKLNEIQNKNKSNNKKGMVIEDENKNSSDITNEIGNYSNNNSSDKQTNLLNNFVNNEDIDGKEKIPITMKKVIIDEPKTNNNINNNISTTDSNKLSPFGNHINEKNKLPSLEIIKKKSEKANQLVSEGKFDDVKEVISNCKEIITYQKGKKLNLLSQMIIKLKKENLNTFIDIIKENPEMINNIELAINAKNSFITPLHYIIEKINQDSSAIEIIEKIFPYITNSDLLKVKDKDGMTIFDRVISINNMEAFKLLYEKILKLDKNWISRKENFIHVQYALLSKKMMTSDELKSIIESIIKIKTQVDELPYNEAITEEKILFLNIINDNSINHQQSLLHIASYINNKNIVNYLLNQENINLDSRDEDGKTPLFYAILSNNNYVATKLINSGANINAMDNLGMTPIFYAIFSKNIEILNTLIRESESKKVDILTKKDFYQRSPLNYALMMENEKMVNLISNYVNEFEKINDIDKRNVLHYAVACKNLNNIKSIFSAITNKNKFIFNHVDNNGRTALHYAAESKNCQILEIFLNHQEYFDFHIKDHFGFKAIDYLLMDEINGDESEYIINNIISLMINNERMFKENFNGKNILFSAFSNPINPDKSIKCILNVFETNQLLDKVKLFITSLINKDTMVLEIGLKNKKINNEILMELIEKTKIETEIGKEELREKLLQNGRKELAIQLGITDIESNDEIANKLIKNKKSIPEIKSLLHIPKNIECDDFKSYDYAILLDKYNWYLELTKSGKMDDDIYKIKEKVLKYNSLNILRELLKLLFNFTAKSLWKIASEEAKEIIINHYKKIGILEKEIIRAANDLNVDFVEKGLNYSINSIIGLLHLAVHNNSKKLAKVILDKYSKKVFEEKIEINGEKMTPSEYILHYENGILNKKEILTYLIMNGAPISLIKKDNLNETEELINALISNVKEKANLLLLPIDEFEEEIDKKILNKYNINEIDSIGNTFIFYAIESNDKFKVECLFDKFPNLNINIENNNHETPLYYAIKYANKDIVELLIKKGSNVNVEIDGKSMLHYAFKRKTTIQSEGNKEKVIMEAKTKSSVALLLMKKGLIDLTPSTINETVKYSWGRNYENITQLMYQIIEENQEKAIKLINSENIDLSIRDGENCTAYAYAKYKKNAELIKLLEEKGCDKEEQEKILKDFFGLTNTRTAMTMSGGLILESFDYLTKNTPVEKLYNLIQTNKIIEMGLNFIDDDKKELMNEMIKYKKKFEEMIS